MDQSNEAFIRIRRNDLGNRDSVTLRDDSSVNYTVDANTNRSAQIDGSNPHYQGYLPRRTKIVPDTFNFPPLIFPFNFPPSAIETSYNETKLDTKKWMKEFRDLCPCILDGAHKGESSCCSYP